VLIDRCVRRGRDGRFGPSPPSLGPRPIGPALAHDIGGQDAVAQGVTQRVEPAPATVCVDPPFGMYPLGIGAMKEVVRPFRIFDFGRVSRAGDVRLATAAELDLGTWAAIGAGNEQHDALLSGPLPRPPPHRSGSRSRSGRS